MEPSLSVEQRLKRLEERIAEQAVLLSELVEVLPWSFQQEYWKRVERIERRTGRPLRSTEPTSGSTKQKSAVKGV